MAEHFTRMENQVNKVERQVNKSVAAILFKDRIGDNFEALVTGAAAKGTWVRLIKHPIEGKLVSGQNNLDVGDQITVKLKKVNVSKGFIDFVRVD
jgi:exoribonuclease-2